MSETDAKRFKGFALPTYTQVPNEALDAMPDLTGAEFKCLVYVIRNTFGYHERVKVLSLTQFMNGRFKNNGERLDYGTGLTRETVVIALRALVSKGYLIEFTTSGDSARAEKAYQLNILHGDEENIVADNDQSENPTTLVGKSDHPSRKIRLRTKKETIERNKEKEPIASNDAVPEKTKPSKAKKAAPKPRSECEPEPVYEAVERLVFNIVADPQDPYSWKSPIGGIVLWLKRSIARWNTVDIGLISAPAEPRHIADFVAWYKKAHNNISLPQEPVKFARYWREFGSQFKAKASAPVRSTKVDDDAPEQSEADREAIRQKIAAKRKGGNPWHSN